MLISFVTFYSCSNIETENLEKSIEHEVYVADGMFVFQSHDHMASELRKIAELSFSDKEAWFAKFGMNTYGRIFNQVMLAEDSISNYFESLTLEEQEYYRSQTQIFSEAYKNAMNDGYIKVETKHESSYFDINLYEKTFADFVNTDGKVKIGNSVFLINDCEARIYENVMDEDLNDLNEKKYVTINKEIDDRLKSIGSHDWSEVKAAHYYDRNWAGNPRKRIWAEIEGESHMYIWYEDQPATSDCCEKVYSKFVLKAYSQKKNFWGNWVFSGDFSPLVEIDGSWDIRYAVWTNDNDPNDDCLCSYSWSDRMSGYIDLPNYYCTLIDYEYCPSSPIEMSAYGNSWQPSVSPTGIFSYTVLNYLWWADSFSIENMDITIRIDDEKSFVFTN